MAFLALALLLSGCNRKTTTPVTGTVKFAGELVPNGQILFIPADRSVAPAAGRIESGVYHLQASVGSKRVEIRASKEVRRVPGALGPEFQDYIPAEFNKLSELKAEVTSTGENQIDFNLQPHK